jgi:hypothetical protein
MRRRLAITGLAVLACTTFATAACSPKPANPATTTAPAKAATQILGEAAAKAKGQSFKYSLKYGTALTGDGAQDATGANATRNISFTDASSGLVIKGQVMLAANVLYAKLDLGPLTALIPGLAGANGKWLTIDQKKIASTGLAASLIPGGDSTMPETYVNGVVSAQSVSPTEIKGTIDLAKSAPKVIPAAEIAKLPAGSKTVPFTATLDDQARIVKIVMTLPKISVFPASDLITTYSDYGSPVQITAPAAADTVVAPDLVYQFLQ